jgi:hypothetical protein
MGWSAAVQDDRAEQTENDDDDELFDLSSAELASMKDQLMEMKQVREEQRITLRRKWETCQLRCCSKAAGVCTSSTRTLFTGGSK